MATGPSPRLAPRPPPPGCSLQSRRGLSAPPVFAEISLTFSVGRELPTRRLETWWRAGAMATAQLEAVTGHIRRLAADSKMSEQSDGALLRAFLERSDQVAFEALL